MRDTKMSMAALTMKVKLFRNMSSEKQAVFHAALCGMEVSVTCSQLSVPHFAISSLLKVMADFLIHKEMSEKLTTVQGPHFNLELVRALRTVLKHCTLPLAYDCSCISTDRVCNTDMRYNRTPPSSLAAPAKNLLIHAARHY